MVDETIRIKTFSSNEIAEARRKIDEAKQLKREEDSLRRRGGIFAADTEEGETRRTVLSRRQQAAAVRPTTRDTTSRSAFTRTNQFRELANKAKENERKLKEVTQKQKELQDKFFSKIEDASNLVGGLDNVPGSVSNFLGKFGTIGVLIGSMLGPALALYFKEFERGGVFSTKLKVTKDALTINDIDLLAEVTSGTKYLSSDLRVVQGAPSNSNTQNLRYEHIRYVMEDVGRPS